MKELSSKQKQIAKRRFNLLKFIGSFGYKGCWWEMNRMLPVLRCTKKQLRNDINYLIKKGTIVSVPKKQGKKIVRTLHTEHHNEDAYPDVVRYKVYDVEPKTIFDLNDDERIEFNSNGYTAEQYYGVWRYDYTELIKRAQ